VALIGDHSLRWPQPEGIAGAGAVLLAVVRATGAFGLLLGLLLMRSTPVSGLKPLFTSSGVSSVLMLLGVRLEAVNGVSPELFCAIG
jgi:hypothetical protein